MMSEEPSYSLMKALSNELSAFMMRIVDNIFARHIMNGRYAIRLGDHLAPL
jgi:hypothetical protein